MGLAVLGTSDWVDDELIGLPVTGLAVVGKVMGLELAEDEALEGVGLLEE